VLNPTQLRLQLVSLSPELFIDLPPERPDAEPGKEVMEINTG
jgi:hypothetical protein